MQRASATKLVPVTKHVLDGRPVRGRAPQPERFEIFSIACEDKDRWRHFLRVERELSICTPAVESPTRPAGHVKQESEGNLGDRRQDAIKLDLFSLCRFQPLLCFLTAQRARCTAIGMLTCARAPTASAHSCMRHVCAHTRLRTQFAGETLWLSRPARKDGTEERGRPIL